MALPSFLLRRVLQALPTVLILLAAVFWLVRLTGDPARLYLGDFATPEAVQEVRERWGLDRPVLVQFVDYVGGVLTGDLGQSLRYSRPVSQLIASRIGMSALLAFTALVLAVAVSVPLGTLAAIYRGTWIDSLIRLLIVVGQAVPRFYLGILLIILFSLYLDWFPTSGAGTFRHLVLPAVTLATPSIALLARLTRSSVIDVLGQDFVRTARSKGVRPLSVIARHVLRNALIAPVTVIAIQFSQLMGGAVVVETVFGWPGLGQLAVQSVYTRDFVLIQGSVLVFTAIVVAMNIVTDALYGFLDPRIRIA